MAPDLVTVGGLTMDNVIASDGTVALSRVGGNAAYSAVGALAWTERVGIVSLAVATYPRDVLARLEANGVGLEGVAFLPAALSACDWFIYDAAGDRHERLRSRPEELGEAGFATDRLTPAETARWIELLKARPDPAEPSYSQFRDLHPLRPEQVPAAYRAARGVHLAPCRPVVLAGMLPLFRQEGRTITLDSGWQLAAEPLDAIAPFLAAADAFLPSAVELAALVPGAGPADALRVLAPLCRGTVVVKLGREGSLVWDAARGEAVAVPALLVDTVDPTGAGDSYCGGFLAGLVETGDPLEAARHGTISASRCVTRFGADGALPPDRVACRTALAALASDRSRPPVLQRPPARSSSREQPQ